MSEKNKTDFLKIAIGAALAAASVLSVWIFEQPGFQSISAVLIIAAAVAFLIEIAVLLLFNGKNIIKRTVKIAVLFAVNISVFTFAVIYSFAPAVILQPHSDEASYEALQSEPFAEEISFEGTNGKINGWFYNRAGDNAPTVLYFYGNYETASTRLLNLVKNYENSAFGGCNFAVFDYPAYGKSEGKCSDDALLSFSLDVYKKISERTENIIVLGYSVGTGPAAYLASQTDVKALILYAPYSNGIDLYNNVIDIFHGPLEKLVAFNIKSEEYALNVTEKTLITASPTDELIPFYSSENLCKSFTDCELFTVQGIGHNDFFTSGEVREKTVQFINEVMAE